MILYIDCIGGVAGDMLLGALLDAGATRRPEPRRPGDRDRHGRAARDHRDDRDACTGAAEQPHRDWATIRALIDAADLPERAKHRAQEAFKRLAIAEGKIHGIDPERVHFHEVGAIDAIGEIVGVALALESLGIDRVICSPLPMGRGFVDAAHGRLPLPAPATLELLRGAPIHGVEIELELVTPTGAALVAALADALRPAPAHDARGARLRRRHARPQGASRTSSARSSAPRPRPAPSR